MKKIVNINNYLVDKEVEIYDKEMIQRATELLARDDIAYFYLVAMTGEVEDGPSSAMVKLDASEDHIDKYISRLEQELDRAIEIKDQMRIDAVGYMVCACCELRFPSKILGELPNQPEPNHSYCPDCGDELCLPHNKGLDNDFSEYSPREKKA